MAILDADKEGFLRSARALIQTCGRAARKAWGKAFPAAVFDMETVKSELWVNQADGIEVSLSDETQTVLKRYLVDGGEWRE